MLIHQYLRENMTNLKFDERNYVNVKKLHNGDFSHFFAISTSKTDRASWSQSSCENTITPFNKGIRQQLVSKTSRWLAHNYHRFSYIHTNYTNILKGWTAFTACFVFHVEFSKVTVSNNILYGHVHISPYNSPYLRLETMITWMEHYAILIRISIGIFSAILVHDKVYRTALPERLEHKHH